MGHVRAPACRSHEPLAGAPGQLSLGCLARAANTAAALANVICTEVHHWLSLTRARRYVFPLAQRYGSNFTTYRIVPLANNDQILRAVVSQT